MLKVFCNRCRVHTSHEVLFNHKDTYTPDNTPGMQIDFAECHSEVLKCCGCGAVTFCETWVTSEDWNPDTKEMEPQRTVYPPRCEDFAGKSFVLAPQVISKIYDEVIGSYNAGYYTLCAAGVRALVEAVCEDQGIAKGLITSDDGKVKLQSTLEGKIAGMAQAGLLTPGHARALHELRWLGNIALHQLARPSRESLKTAVAILEHTLESIYSLDQKTYWLRVLRGGAADG